MSGEGERSDSTLVELFILILKAILLVLRISYISVSQLYQSWHRKGRPPMIGTWEHMCS
jgi:hypothetical protein